MGRRINDLIDTFITIASINNFTICTYQNIKLYYQHRVIALLKVGKCMMNGKYNYKNKSCVIALI